MFDMSKFQENEFVVRHANLIYTLLYFKWSMYFDSSTRELICSNESETKTLILNVDDDSIDTYIGDDILDISEDKEFGIYIMDNNL